MTTTTIDKPRRHISAITAEYRPFWQPLFDNMGLSNPLFGAKLCYLGKEFANDGSRELCLRFFPSELNNGQDYYTELFNWDQDRYYPEKRILFRLKFDPEWQKNTHKYVEVPSDKMSTSTYAVRLSDLEMINTTSATALTPTLVKPESGATLFSAPGVADKKDPFDEESLSEMFTEKEDQHYSSMTMRDLYCMLQNVPLTNKKWLNQLIEKGTQWQQQK